MRGQYANKRDANEAEVVQTLRGYGFSVVTMDQPADLLCGFRGQTYLVEVKMPKGKLTPSQARFYEGWRGQYDVIRSTQDAEEWARKIRGQE